MLNNRTLILISTAAFCWLFYHQSDGINYLIFNVLLLVALLLRDSTLLKSKTFLSIATAALASAIAIYWYGTDWPFQMNILSLLALAGYSYSRESSLLVAIFHGGYSFFASPVVHVFDRLFKSADALKTKESRLFKRVVLSIVPLVVVFIFIQIYRSGNPIFDKYVSELNFDFISLEWLFFMLYGAWLMFAFFKQSTIRKLQHSDIETPDALRIITEEEHTDSYFGQLIQIPNEVFTGVLLFALLNVLLACVNGLDFYFVFFKSKLPEGISISQYVHNGTNSLITSIVLASLIILFYFRGYLNYYSKSSWLKGLAYLWILQNALLIFSTAYRNGMYIDGFGLTHKRIGVLIYLLLTMIGLLTVAIKIALTKNNWFLFRKNAWAIYLTLIVYVLFDWDSVITNYNLHHFETDKKMEIDQRYLVNLSHTNLTKLFEFYLVKQKKLNDKKQDIDNEYNEDSFSSSSGRSSMAYTQEIERMVWDKYRELKADYKTHDWPSECYTRTKNLRETEALIAQYQLKEVLPVNPR
jgi:hypothetical protein